MLSYLLEYNRYLNIVGIAVVIGLGFLFSRKRSHIKWRLVASALGLQFAIAILVLKVNIGRRIVEAVAVGVSKIYQFADHGSRFIFGNLVDADGAWGFIFAFKILPVIIFFGALTALLFHLRIVQFFVSLAERCIRPLLKTSGAETLCAVANSFLGQTEAPLLVKNYLRSMTKSELFVVMVSGMATISGAILVVFAAMGVPADHMLAASVMAIPASIMMAKILYPETEKTETAGDMNVNFEPQSKNALDAISVGTSDGLRLAVNVAAMLISFIALFALANYIIALFAIKINVLLAAGGIGFQLPVMTLDVIFSYIFAPFAYLLGFTGSDATAAGELLGIKVTVNELVAYSKMITLNLSERTKDIITYALCGFSNFSCIGIQIGGIGALVPEKRRWLTELGLFAVLGSSMANLLSALIAAFLI